MTPIESENEKVTDNTLKDLSDMDGHAAVSSHSDLRYTRRLKREGPEFLFWGLRSLQSIQKKKVNKFVFTEKKAKTKAAKSLRGLPVSVVEDVTPLPLTHTCSSYLLQEEDVW